MALLLFAAGVIVGIIVAGIGVVLLVGRLTAGWDPEERN